MAWQVTAEDVETFRRELWKDERLFPRPRESATFVKDCFREEAAAREYAALRLLSSLGAEAICPAPIGIQGSQLEMEAVDGMRLFEVLRCLRELELRVRDGRAHRARDILLARQRQRLARIQVALLEGRDLLAPTAYPLGEKVQSLLGLLTRVLGIGTGQEVRQSLETFAEYWRAACSQVPFRDAAPKNVIVVHPLLRWQARRTLEDVDAVARVLETGGSEIWEAIGLRDVDFASVENLTSLEDDPISLHFHEWTYGSCPLEASSLLLVPAAAQVDSYRTAATFVVRYLRFGGRKLAYRLINAEGHEIRFRYDDALFYFRTLQPIVTDISPGFAHDYKPLLGVIRRIGEVAAEPSPADRSMMQIDHFRARYGYGGDYYSENPVIAE